MKLLMTLVLKFFKKNGFEIVPINPTYPLDLIEDTTFLEIYEKCRAFTMTSIERMYALYKSILYISKTMSRVTLPNAASGKEAA